MPCENHRTALSEAAASGAELESAARAHLESCGPCRAFFAEEQALFGIIDNGLRAAANADVPPDFLPRVRVGLTEESAPQRRWVFAPAALATAAVLLSAFVAVRIGRHAGQPGTTDPILGVQSTSLPAVVAPRQETSSETSSALAASVRHRPSSSRRPPTTSEEPEVLVPAGQEKAVALLIAELRRGEVNGEVLLAEARNIERAEIRISPLSVRPLEVQPLENPGGQQE
jgi:hypothetical protein